MTAMLRAGSDKAAELYLEVNRKANDYVRAYEGKIIKGRQIIAMMYESFRTRDSPGLPREVAVPRGQQATSVQADVVGNPQSDATGGHSL